MLTSLLSLYIASILHSDIVPSNKKFNENPVSIVKTASYSEDAIENTKYMPIKNPEFIAPIINARSSIVMDLKTGLNLFEKNAHERREIASLTKLMTALIILEENDLDEIVTIGPNAVKITGSVMFLRNGEKMTVKSLILGMIVNSSNDAAIALAEYNAGSIKDFVEKMNNKALALGLVNTHFSNPVGLDDPENYSSAYDLAKLSQYIYQKSFIRESAKIKEILVSSVDGSYTHNLKTTNDLLDDKFFSFKGLKTGTTDQAGLCIITIAENENGNEILTVLLNSPNRFQETKILVDWTFRAYNWQR